MLYKHHLDERTKCKIKIIRISVYLLVCVTLISILLIMLDFINELDFFIRKSTQWAFIALLHFFSNVLYSMEKLILCQFHPVKVAPFIRHLICEMVRPAKTSQLVSSSSLDTSCSKTFHYPVMMD